MSKNVVIGTCNAFLLHASIPVPVIMHLYFSLIFSLYFQNCFSHFHVDTHSHSSLEKNCLIAHYYFTRTAHVGKGLKGLVTTLTCRENVSACLSLFSDVSTEHQIIFRLSALFHSSFQFFLQENAFFDCVIIIGIINTHIIYLTCRLCLYNIQIQRFWLEWWRRYFWLVSD